MKAIITRLINSVFVQHCFLCKTKSTLIICTECKHQLKSHATRCPRCARPSTSNMACISCQAEPPVFDKAYACFDYNDVIKYSIQQFKYHEALYFAPFFAACLHETINWNEVDAILAVPLHRKRLVSRGYNQSQELAKRLRRQTSKPVVSHYVKRIKNTAPQHTLNKTARAKNPKGAFKLIKPIPYTKLLIIDDVMTTASTLNALCKALQQARSHHIIVACVARA
ncbi:MAG: hypothetical protein COV52_07710 [Gammaproteobacteria bacterium CG11_big_fil_rev_8_21_14_0_20_46_22]|nr:MAG: hypothetical protein COW05_03790 [Gammaproteobacteria bacterium CG12_big_fil_rev_8_21_14_0_65_46_12]PIR10643.1 MAG: hypothetical protein COV52_07710 [Gammaproteobacteria bacterium CG11_big_fil_rev_8_21_14_0_20_46_22]